MDLLDLLNCPGGKTLEFKRDRSAQDRALNTIMGFANKAGGTLLIAVENRNRTMRGVADPLDAQERLANLIQRPDSNHRLVLTAPLLPWQGLRRATHGGAEPQG